MSGVWSILLLGTAGFCFGGAYALVKQKKPWWIVGIVMALGLLALAAGWLNL